MSTFILEINEECDLLMSDLEDRLCEILDTFCEALSKDEGMTRSVDDDDYTRDYNKEDVPFMWTDKASRLIDTEIDRVNAIAAKYFTPEQMLEITIETRWYKEF